MTAILVASAAVATCPDCGAACADGAANCPSCKRGLGRLLDAELAAGVPALARTLDIATGLAASMASMHDAKQTHQDLRPRNLYVIPRKGREDAVKLINAQGVPAPGGSTDYAAPEQLPGAAIDARANAYSFGVILHEMATGSRPIRGANLNRSARIRAQPHELPAALEELIVHCLQTAPEKRPQTMREVADRIAALRVAFRAGVLTPTAKPPAASTSPRWPLALVAGLVIAAGGYLGLRFVAPSPPPAPQLVPVIDAAVAPLVPPRDLAIGVDAAVAPDLAAPRPAPKPHSPARSPRPKQTPPPTAAPAPATRDPFAPKR